jgi:hypothetical protein
MMTYLGIIKAGRFAYSNSIMRNDHEENRLGRVGDKEGMKRRDQQDMLILWVVMQQTH